MDMWIENWVIYAFMAAISFAFMALTIRKILMFGLDPIILNLLLFGFTFILFYLFFIFKKISLNVSSGIFLWIILAGIFAFIGNYFDLLALKNAPNPGYASSIKASQVILITLLASLIFNSSLNFLKFFGVFLVFLGVILISI